MKYLRNETAFPTPRHRTPDSQTMSIKQAAGELGGCHTRIYRWLRGAFSTGEMLSTPAQSDTPVSSPATVANQPHPV